MYTSPTSPTFSVAERFKSIQGEGVFCGTPMAFIRLVGCSVGKKICHNCDTDFDKPYNWKGGGLYTVDDLLSWGYPNQHYCITGGEPFDWDLAPLLVHASFEKEFHIESSGTVIPKYLDSIQYDERIHLTVCPKPGWRQEMIDAANEIKIIVGGLGNGDGWPTLEQAIEWAYYKPVFLQPRNKRNDIDWEQLHIAQDLVAQHPGLRLSVQMHKILRVR